MLFTLTTQLGLGFLPVAVFMQWSDATATGRPVLNHAAPSALLIGLALGLVAFGLLASVLHLARPWRSPLALCNLRRSWLSREVLLTSAAAGGLLLAALAPQAPSGGSAVSTVVVAADLVALALAAAAVYSQARCYRVLGRPAWRRSPTLERFLTVGLGVGPLLAAAVAGLAAGGGRAHAAAVFAYALYLSTLALQWERGRRQGWVPRQEVAIGHLFALLAGLAALALGGLGMPGAAWVLLLAAAAATAAATVDRWHFYFRESVRARALPPLSRRAVSADPRGAGLLCRGLDRD